MIEIRSVYDDREARQEAERILIAQLGVITFDDLGVDCFDKREEDVILAAFDDATIVGAGSGRIVRSVIYEAPTDMFEISNIAVVPGRENNKCDRIGSKLLVGLEDAARDLGMHSIRLFSLNDSHGFYDKHGYEYDDPEKKHKASVRVKDIVWF